METSEDTTEEDDGNLRDTLIERWEELDDQAKPIIERMEKIKAHHPHRRRTRPTSNGPAAPDGTCASPVRRAPTWWSATSHDPFDAMATPSRTT